MTDLLPSTARTLLARTARAQRDGRVPSLVAAVVRDGELVWSAGRGAVAEPHTHVQYRLGSISKTVTAITVMRLRDEGAVDLDDPLEKHLPGTPLGDRTLGQLLSHLAGAGSESPGLWWERTPGTTLEGLVLSDADVVLPAARRFHYSNLGFGLLGELVARIRGRAWADVARDEVLLPLGMARTTPRPSGAAAQGTAVHPWADVVMAEPEHHAVAMAPAGQLWATATDLGRLGSFLLGDTGDVLSPDTVEEMTLPAGIDSASPGWSSYGLGVQVQRVDGVTLVGHGGSMPGFLAGLWADREDGTAALALGNTTTGMDGGLPAGLLADVRAAEPRIVDAWAPSPSPVPLDLLGPWFWGPSPYVLRAIPGGMLHLGGLGRPGRSSRFVARPDGTWVGLDGYFAGETLRLDPVALNLATFVFTRTPYDPAAPVPGGVDGAGWHA
ncbi:serine hydrolase [Pseudonocardia sp.]|uniref:serine hydrolase domain-containing protein n=1 Tax=Pseudonocardia sp. TaxID=60912 RepID=UPI00260D1590|nr:serine hydrolase domain-containing protein [Pseudonocardia sp.]MCW2722400.1 beta-lactamase [Pseudonocardia sp.]